MKYTAPTGKRPSTDLVVVPCWKGPKLAAPVGKLKVDPILKVGDFSGKHGSTMLTYIKGERVLLLGLGEKKKCTPESLRRAYAAAVRRCHGKKWKSLGVFIPEECDIQAMCEGISLTAYTFEALKSPKNRETYALTSVALIGGPKEAAKIGREVDAVTTGVTLARDLVNSNAKDINPKTLGDKAKALAKEHSSIKTTVHDKKWIEKQKMDLFLAVGAGSMHDPAFITMSYKGNPKSKDHTIVVGKGVTYDTGGLNIKPTGSMEDMKSDMAGSATAFGLMKAVAKLKLKTNLTVIVAATENSVDAKSYRPGDVYSSYAGTTVEVTNTDAEGRLTLADAIAYAEDKLQPTRIINLATLTGAIVIALGESRSGLFSNNKKLASLIAESGERTGERVWELPLDDDYKAHLKSDIADIKSCGKRLASSITAALFIERFVKKVPWAHLDIAGTAYISKPHAYHMTPATGVGIRLLIDLLTSLSD